MKGIWLFIIACAIGVGLNIPLLVNNEEILISTSSLESGWKTRCVYYKPFDVVTVDSPHYQSCSRVRQENPVKRPGQFFWEQKA